MRKACSLLHRNPLGRPGLLHLVVVLETSKSCHVRVKFDCNILVVP